MSAPQLSVVPATERPLLDPSNPIETAREFLQHRYTVGGQPTLLHNQNEFFEWRTTHYVVLADEEVRAALWRFLEHSERLDKEGQRIPFKPTAQKVNDILAALRAVAQTNAQAPAWVPDVGWKTLAADVRSCANGLLHLPTRRLAPHTPQFFSTEALPYAFDPQAPAPATWLAFLEQLWPGDAETIACLQEWMGYILTPCTKQQKILMIVGPKRSGKGTIARVMTALLGAQRTWLARRSGAWPRSSAWHLSSARACA